MKKINEGAESTIYLTQLLGMEAILKRRMPKSYRIKEIDTKIREFRSRLEARTIAMASRSGINSPKLLLFDGFDIYMTNINGDRLDDYLAAKKAKQKIFQSVGAMLGLLHNSNIAHGDYTPANIIVYKEKAYVIDFGLAQILDSPEEKALDLLLMKRSITNVEYNTFLNGYKSSCLKSADVIKRLAAIERRGRYQTRTIQA